jgi:phage anti-repressor protein
MNQIITPKSINFNELVKNSNTTLSLNIETKMITLLNTEFTDEEQQWYVANLYMYMNYHPTNDYPINLEDVFKMVGFANKGNAMKTIKSNFTEGEDYKVALFRMEKRKNEGGFNKEEVMLNIDTFKNLCMLAKTKKGKEIRKYYVKMENIYNQIIKEEIEEKNELLQEQQKKIELLEHKPKTHGFLARRHGYVYMIKDRAKLGHYKIGMTYNVDKRLRNLNTSSSEKSLSIYHEIETYDCELLEKTLHSILQPFNIVGRREWFFLCNETEVQYTLHIMKKTHEFLNNFNFTSHEQLVDYISGVSKETIEITLPTTITTTNNETKKQQLEQQSESKVPCRLSTSSVKVEETTITKNIRKKKRENIKETNVFKLTGQQFKNKTGKYKGVFWIKEKKKWRGEIKMHYKSIFLGYYSTELEGAKAYNDYALFINNRDNTNYELNDIKDYVPNPRDIPEENKEELDENKTSNYNGVSYYSKRKYYVAGIKYQGKSYGLGKHENEIECAKLYNQQALYFNQEFNTNYILNEIDDYITQPKNIYQEIQDKKSERKTSQYYGVTFSKRNNKFRTVLVHNKKQIHIGFFENEIDAAKAYNQKALELNMAHKTNYKINLIE